MLSLTASPSRSWQFQIRHLLCALNCIRLPLHFPDVHSTSQHDCTPLAVEQDVCEIGKGQAAEVSGS